MTASDIFKVPSRWTQYTGALSIATLVGGIPKDADTVKGWLKARMQLGDAEIMAMVEETMEEMGLPQGQETSEQLDELVDHVMARSGPKGNGFKVIDGELVWEGRCLKGALKEASNILYPGSQMWPGHPGKDVVRKGFRSYLEERVEVADTFISLGRSEPDIAGEQRIKHVSTPAGKRSAINVVDICTKVDITFSIDVLDDCIPPKLWAELWTVIELGGVGADRARGDGRCELTAWDRVDTTATPTRKRSRS
jgi:hypothetical protein